MNTSRVLVIITLLLAGRAAFAYPQFIGYGYTSCLTCHYNAAGGGALNDYGRALFATEITARTVYSKSMSEDDIAKLSRFLVVADLPYWIRPDFKYRDLQLQLNPGSTNGQTMWIPMQREAGLTFSADEDQKYVLVTSADQNSKPRMFSTGTEASAPGWAVKEAYLRLQFGDTNWLYAGQLDKVFGLREVDHTAFSRGIPGLAEYDQSVGAIYNGNFGKWDVFAGAFTGNVAETAAQKQKGFSAMAEYEPREKLRVGFSLLSEANATNQKQAISFHEKMGIGHGHALLGELGLLDNKDLTGATVGPTPRQAYGLLESFIRLDRGYNFLSQVEWAHADINSGTPEQFKFGLGFLLFPLPRSELRWMAQQSGLFRSDSAGSESWALQCQFHLSL